MEFSTIIKCTRITEAENPFISIDNAMLLVTLNNSVIVGFQFWYRAAPTLTQFKWYYNTAYDFHPHVQSFLCLHTNLYGYLCAFFSFLPPSPFHSLSFGDFIVYAVTTFVVSAIVSHHNKLDMVHIQNSTLAGGVAIGTVCNLLVGPHGAVLIGTISAIISVLGYRYLSVGFYFAIHTSFTLYHLAYTQSTLSTLSSVFSIHIIRCDSLDWISLSHPIWM